MILNDSREGYTNQPLQPSVCSFWWPLRPRSEASPATDDLFFVCLLLWKNPRCPQHFIPSMHCTDVCCICWCPYDVIQGQWQKHLLHRSEVCHSKSWRGGTITTTTLGGRAESLRLSCFSWMFILCPFQKFNYIILIWIDFWEVSMGTGVCWFEIMRSSWVSLINGIFISDPPHIFSSWSQCTQVEAAIRSSSKELRSES